MIFFNQSRLNQLWSCTLALVLVLLVFGLMSLIGPGTQSLGLGLGLEHICYTRPAHTQTDETMNTALRPKNFDERSRDVVKIEKICSFQVHTTSLLRPCQVLTSSNTFQLSSYHVRERAYHVQCVLTTF